MSKLLPYLTPPNVRSMQAVRFRLYKPAKYLADLIRITIENNAPQPQVQTPYSRGLRVLLLSDDREYTSEQQFAPFFAYRQVLRHEYRLAFNHMLISDILQLPAFFIKTYDLILVKFSFQTPDTQARQIIKQLYEMKGRAKLVYCDGDDDLCIQWPELLYYVDLYIKKHLFKDPSQYQKEYLGKSNLTDYVARNWEVSFARDIVPHSKPVNANYFDKIVLGYNVALDDKIRELYKQTLTKNISKDNDIILRATVSQSSWSYYLRKDLISSVQEMAVKYKVIASTKRVSQEEYYYELIKSKICVSPFGYGEICWRDFEAVLCRCLLVKPDMSHVKTEPDIFIPYETYIPVKWDFGDLQEKCIYYLEHKDEQTQIVEKAYQTLSNFYSNDMFLRKLQSIFERLELR